MNRKLLLIVTVCAIVILVYWFMKRRKSDSPTADHHAPDIIDIAPEYTGALHGGPAPTESHPAVPNYIDIICSTWTVTTETYYVAGALQVDIYKETCNTNNNRPVMISLHPGGGTRTEFTTKKMAREFAKRGWLGVAPDYGDTNPFTPQRQLDAVQNICGLIRWLRANATRLGINPNNIFIMGLSAGAVTAVQTGMAAWAVDAHIASPLLYPEFDNAINGENTGYSSLPTATASLAGSASAVFITDYLTPQSKRNFFSNGDEDCTIYYSIAQACSFCSDCSATSGALDTYNAQIALSISSTFVPYPGVDHAAIGSHLDSILLGGDLQIDGITIDPGVVIKFAGLLVP